ncbi:MAG: hypothetical protein AAFR16_09640, partial [Pseudomonadota bacterium]
HRAATGQPLLAADDPTVRAVASDAAGDAARFADLGRPIFDLDAVARIADHILDDAPPIAAAL